MWCLKYGTTLKAHTAIPITATSSARQSSGCRTLLRLTGLGECATGYNGGGGGFKVRDAGPGHSGIAQRLCDKCRVLIITKDCYISLERAFLSGHTYCMY